MPSSEHRRGDCRIAVQAIVAGDQDTRVQAVTAAASPSGKPYIAIRVGRVLLYVEDRAALEAFGKAFDRARGHADEVFGHGDAFAEAEAWHERQARAAFERGERPKP